MKTLILSAIVACIAVPAVAQVYRPAPQPLPNMQQPIYQPPPPQPIYVPPAQYNPPPMQQYQQPRQTTCQFIGAIMYCN